MVSVVINGDIPWYAALIKELIRNANVRNSLRWEWINEVLNRFNAVEIFNRIISQ
ncbi:hypothetical protein [Vulcanisaeta sp. JCM 16161]|uniref:hypothetical protein n=1 Tax=Vulcanisaeta sp. JCM 16161 TaxID=1295372 RepID=UPI000B2F9C2D|nr:hypothetical protein [Vulcanisaeta sp. JCM 16161]